MFRRGLEWVNRLHAAFISQDESIGKRTSLTAIESFTFLGRLDSLSAADAADANRTEVRLMRGARNAAHTR